MIEHLSSSSIARFLRCGEQFRRIYIEGERVPPGIAMATGAGVHRAAETNHRQKMTSGVDMPPNQIVECAVAECEAAMRKDGIYLTREDIADADKLIGEGIDFAASAGRCYATQVAPTIQPAAVEERDTIDDNGAGLLVPIVGIVDVVDTSGTIVDLKTAAKAWPAGREHKEIQPTIYAEMRRRRTGNRAPFRYDCLIAGKKETRHEARTTERDGADWAAFVRTANAVWASICRGDFTPTMPDNWWCSERFCGFWTNCRYVSDRLRRLPNVSK